MKIFHQNSILNTVNYPHAILDLDPNKLHNDNLTKYRLQQSTQSVRTQSNTKLEPRKIPVTHVHPASDIGLETLHLETMDPEVLA